MSLEYEGYQPDDAAAMHDATMQEMLVEQAQLEAEYRDYMAQYYTEEYDDEIAMEQYEEHLYKLYSM